MIRLVMNVDQHETRHDFYSDAPIDVFIVRDHLDNWLSKPTVTVGVQHVRAQLGDDPVGHKHDSHSLSSGHGPRRLPMRAGLAAVSNLFQRPQVVIKIDPQGCWEIYSDVAVAVFIVADHCPHDRVYQPEIVVDPEQVRVTLRKPAELSDPFALSPEQEERLRKDQLLARKNRRHSRIKRAVSGLFDLLFAAAFAAAVGIQTFALMHTQLTN